jgi:glycine/serine hydroxymethyltransferase
MRNGRLSDIGQGWLKNLLGTYMSDPAGFSSDAGSLADAETDNTVGYCINGIFYTLTADANIDISAALGKDGATYAPTVLKTGYSRAYVVSVDSAGVYYVTEGETLTNADYTTAALAAADILKNHLPDVHIVSSSQVETDVCPIGCVIVHNASVGDFTFGTTLMDVANVTDTWYDFSRMP